MYNLFPKNSCCWLAGILRFRSSLQIKRMIGTTEGRYTILGVMAFIYRFVSEDKINLLLHRAVLF